MLDDDDFDAEFDTRTKLQRLALPLGLVAAVGVVGLGAYFVLRGGESPLARPHNEPHITQVQLPPPPPPPPPPKTPPPPKKPEVMPKAREAAPTRSVSKPVPKAPAPPASVTTSIAGPGNSGLAVGNDGGGTSLGTGSGEDGGGDNDAYYRDLIQQRIQNALRHDEKLRYATYTVGVSFTIDPSGGFANPSVASFSGDSDARSEVERLIREASTGDTPAASMVGKRVLIKITERAQG